jgi:hypothetical protein
MLDHEKLDVYLVDPSLYQEGKNLLVRIVARLWLFWPLPDSYRQGV